MKPKLRIEAPLARRSRSITATRLPDLAAAQACARPMMPPPTMARSKLCDVMNPPRRASAHRCAIAAAHDKTDSGSGRVCRLGSDFGFPNDFQSLIVRRTPAPRLVRLAGDGGCRQYRGRRAGAQ